MASEICVVVHSGAGFHSKSKENLYNQLCSDVCRRTVNLLENNQSALDAAEFAVSVLEDSKLTNAGTGSNLTLNGSIECEAGIMCGRSKRFAAVGCVSDIKNPINLARLLLDNQLKNPISPMGRIAPSFLSGKGAIDWALATAPSRVQTSNLETKESRSKWLKYHNWMKDLEPAASIISESRPESPSSKRIRIESSLDTVGAVCLDTHGHLACSVSSGGIALKQEGRIGQCCVYGCGCWIDYSDDLSSRVSVVASGTGEQLVRTQLPQRIGQNILDSDQSIPEILDSSMNKFFVNSKLLEDESPKYAGIAGLYSEHLDEKKTFEVFFAHTTNSMSCAYFAPLHMSKPSAFISRLKSNKSFIVNAYAFAL